MNHFAKQFLLIIFSFFYTTQACHAASIGGPAQVGQCDQATYTITVENTSSQPVTLNTLVNDISVMPGFSYVDGSTFFDSSGAAACADPTTASTAGAITWSYSSCILAAGENTVITYDLQTACDASSGFQQVSLDYTTQSGAPGQENDQYYVATFPGSVTIKKSPAVQSAAVGDDITWTLEIENTGLGPISNVTVSDSLGAGLQYASDDNGGSNSGQDTTWNLGSMVAGETRQIGLAATVSGCVDLNNTADVSWGCSAGGICFDTVVDGGSATASVQRIARTPLLHFTLPAIEFSYCEEEKEFDLIVTNNGDGTASNIKAIVDLSPLTVTAVSGASYDTTIPGFSLDAPIAAGESTTITFTLQNPDWCSDAPFPGPTILWQRVYEDGCGNPFYAVPQIGSISQTDSRPALNISKTGAGIVERGGTATYTINASISGSAECIANTGPITFTDTIPDGFTVASSDPLYSYWVPGTDGTGGTITWTDSSASPWSETVTLIAPDSGCEMCGQTYTNSVTAVVESCCNGCILSGESSTTTAIECDSGYLTSDKTATPQTQERCGVIAYTTTYNFSNSGDLSGASLSDLTFQEQANESQSYVDGSLSVTFNGTDITGCADDDLVNNTPGGGLTLEFSGCAGEGSIQNSTLIVSYELEASENTGNSCSAANFNSWSTLDFDPSVPLTAECPKSFETIPVEIVAPDMNLSLSGLGSIVEKCGVETVTLTLNQGSTLTNPYDVKLLLEGINYYVVDPTTVSCTGDIIPTNCTNPDAVGEDYVWNFEDLFTSAGQSVTISADVAKRCDTDGANLTAIVYYDDLCANNEIGDEKCSRSATLQPALITGANLIIEKTPEVIQAIDKTVEWTIYVTNTGDGVAHNVWVDDLLGAGLRYISLADDPASVTVTPSNGSTITQGENHLGQAIPDVITTIAIEEIAPGTRVEITLKAAFTGCENLTNEVSTSWGCNDTPCQTPVSDTSLVKIPPPNVVLSTNIGNSLPPCSDNFIELTLKNSGRSTIYDLAETQSLVQGLTYKVGSTTWTHSDGESGTGEPNTTTTDLLSWATTEIPKLESLDPGDSITIRFVLETDCTWTGGTTQVTATYNTVCGDPGTPLSKSVKHKADNPDLTITKTLLTSGPVNCGDVLEWQIQIDNNSAYDVPIVKVVDTLGDAYTYVNGSASIVPDTIIGQELTWFLGPLTAGNSETITFQATASDGTPGSGCEDDDNTVVAYWGCTVDCISDNGAQTETQTPEWRPTLVVDTIDYSPPATCGGTGGNGIITYTLRNTGLIDANNIDLSVTLPAGLLYVADTTSVTCPSSTNNADPEGGTGPTLDFYNSSNTSINLCDSIGAGESATLEFEVSSDGCFVGGNLETTRYFYGCCDDKQYTATGPTETLAAENPNLTIVKSLAPDQDLCASSQTWYIDVSNNGVTTAEYIEIEDTPGDWLNITNVTPATDLTESGGVYSWTYNNLAVGATQRFTVTTAFDGPAPRNDCSDGLRTNNARTRWYCEGASCTNPTWVEAPAVVLPIADLQVTDIIPEISCGPADGQFGSSISVVVENSGTKATDTSFTVTVVVDGWTGTGLWTESVPANGSVTVTIDTTGWTPTCNDCNPYTLTATVDTDDTVCECDETNNNFQVDYVAPIPKLELTTVTPLPMCNGESSVDVLVTNSGCAIAPAGVEVRIQGDVTGTADTVTDIAVGGTETISVSLGEIECDNSYTFTATIDPEGELCECSDADHISDPVTFDSPCCSIDLEKATNTIDADTPTGPFIPAGDPVTWSYLITNTGNTILNNISLVDDQLGDIAGSCNEGIIPALDPSDSFTCTVAGTATAGQYENTADTAGTPVDASGNEIGAPVTDSDPSHYFGSSPAIDIEKATNTEDADTGTGPFIPLGDPVTWTYVITNTGNIDLDTITLVDDQLGDITSSCNEGAIPLLAPTESFTCTITGTATEGQYENNAVTTGTPVDSTGNPLDLAPVTDTDPSHYFGTSPGIDLEKATNTEDADTPTGPFIAVGDTVTWSYVITNTGNIALSSLTLVDNQLGDIANSCNEGAIPLLAPAASFTCTVTGTATEGQYENNAVTTGTPVDGSGNSIGFDPVTDSDPSHYYGSSPAIDLEKSTNTEDADTVTGPFIAVGDTVTWSYVITNSGNTRLGSITLVDDQLGDITSSCNEGAIPLLAPAESFTCTVTGVAIEGQYANSGVTTGTPVDSLGNPTGLPDVTDTDPSHYFGTIPGIDLEKATNTEDADTPTGPFIAVGNTVTWNYVITNTGNISLNNITLVDDQLGNIASSCNEGAIPLLAPAESFTCTITGTATDGQYENNAVTTGSPVDGSGNPIDLPAVTDDDPSHYYGTSPAIDLEKATNTEDADTGTGPFIPVGDTVTWAYVITNTGNIALSSITLVDNQLGDIADSCNEGAIPLLAPAASFTCTVTGTAIEGQYANSAITTGTPVDDSGTPIGFDPVTDTDPSHYFGASPAIDLEKSTNTEDADTPTGPFIPVGDTVTWVYVITNTGNTALTGITLVDDQLGDITGSCNEGAIPLLAPAASFTCTVPGAATNGQYENNAVTTGAPADGSGNPVDLPAVTDSDPSHYFGTDPSVDLEKKTNGEDADTPTGPYIGVGETVTWSYVITNTGNIALDNFTLVDDQLGDISGSCSEGAIPRLEPGNIFTCTVTGVATTEQYENNAETTGTPVDEFGNSIGFDPVTDNDPSHYFGEEPSIDIEKYTNDEDADTPSGVSLMEGDKITWTYVVTNTGNVELSNIAVTDSEGVDVSCPKTVLAIGQSMTCTGTGKATPGQYENIGSVTGLSPGNREVTDKDPSHYYARPLPIVGGGTPEIVLSKVADPTRVAAGDIIKYTVQISNTSAWPATNVVVRDTLPSGFTYISGTSLLDGGKISDPSGKTNLTWIIQSVDAGQTRSLSYQVRVPVSLSSDRYTNTISSDSSEASATVTTVQDSLDGGCCLTADKELISHQPKLSIIPAKQDLYFITHMAMFASWELAHLDDIYDGIGENQQLNHKIALHKEKLIGRLTRFSRNNIGNLTMRSGLGLEMADVFGGNAGDLKSRKEKVQLRLKQFAEETGWAGDIATINPIFLEYYGGLPTRGNRDDQSWDENSMRNTFSPASWGMTLLSQSFELDRLTRSSRSEDRFIARVLSWQMQEKIAFITTWLKNNAANYNYLPHELAIESREPLQLKVSDATSSLFDQAAMLWGLSNLEMVVTDNKLGGFEQLNQLGDQMWASMLNHFDPEKKIWRSVLSPQNPEAETKKGAMETDELQPATIEVVDLLVAALAADAKDRTDGSWLDFGKYKKPVEHVVTFLRGYVSDDSTLAEKLSYEEENQTIQPGSLIATAALIRLEQLAGKTTEASERFNALEKVFWDKDNQLYRDTSQWDFEATYDPVVMAVFTDMLRGLSQGKSKPSQEAIDRGLAFMDRILYQAGLQLSEEVQPKEKRLPVIAFNETTTRPIYPIVSETETDRYINLHKVSVFCKEVSINLRPLDGRGQNSENETILNRGDNKFEQKMVFSQPSKVLSRQKLRVIRTGSTALGANYLAETAGLLQQHSMLPENPYFGDTFGLAHLAKKHSFISLNSLFSIGNYYNQGIPLKYAGALIGDRLHAEKAAAAMEETITKLTKKHLNQESQKSQLPIYLEYDQGEPVSSIGGKGWASRPKQEQLSLTTITQIERNRLRFIANYSEMVRDIPLVEYLRELSGYQTNGKLLFLQDLIKKSNDLGLKRCPEKINIVRDSRGLPLESVFQDTEATDKGQFSLLLVFADTLGLSEEIRKQISMEQITLLELQTAFNTQFDAILSDFVKTPIDNSPDRLLDTAITLDLMTQLYTHPAMSAKQQEALKPLITARTQHLLSWTKKVYGKKDLKAAVLGLEVKENHLASFSAALMALIRVNQLEYQQGLSETIGTMARTFDKELWNEMIGCYQGVNIWYNSSEMRSVRYPYSELDISLTIAALAHSINYLDQEKAFEVLTHITSFSNRLLGSAQLSSSLLTSDNPQVTDYDTGMLQGVELRLVDTNKVYVDSLLEYQINIYNRCPNGQSAGANIDSVDVTDILPDNVSYVPGSSRIDGASTPDPESRNNRITWQTGNIFNKTSITFYAQIDDTFDNNNLENRVKVIGWQGADRTGTTCDWNYKLVTPVSGKHSTIRIKYFEDSNGNNEVDPGENGISDINTWLSSEAPQISGENGEAIFRNLTPGFYQAHPAWNAAIPPFIFSATVPVETAVRDYEDKIIPIGLMTTTELSGWIFEDLNGDGLKNNDEPPLTAVKVETVGDGRFYAFSATDGYFKIERIPLGAYKDVQVAGDQPYAENLPAKKAGLVIDASAPR